MEKLYIEIQEIKNGWLLTIEGDMSLCVDDLYIETFPKVLEYLGSLKVLEGDVG